jgi:hypothetical protein
MVFMYYTGLWLSSLGLWCQPLVEIPIYCRLFRREFPIKNPQLMGTGKDGFPTRWKITEMVGPFQRYTLHSTHSTWGRRMME